MSNPELTAYQNALSALEVASAKCYRRTPGLEVTDIDARLQALEAARRDLRLDELTADLLTAEAAMRTTAPPHKDPGDSVHALAMHALVTRSAARSLGRTVEAAHDFARLLARAVRNADTALTLTSQEQVTLAALEVQALEAQQALEALSNAVALRSACEDTQAEECSLKELGIPISSLYFWWVS